MNKCADRTTFAFTSYNSEIKRELIHFKENNCLGLLDWPVIIINDNYIITDKHIPCNYLVCNWLMIYNVDRNMFLWLYIICVYVQGFPFYTTAGHTNSTLPYYLDECFLRQDEILITLITLSYVYQTLTMFVPLFQNFFKIMIFLVFN